jgi:hypothetical protein
MSSTREIIATNLERVRERIAAACARCGRSTDEIRLVAVTKYADLEWAHHLVELGVRDLGESRPQQLIERISQFDHDVRWHLIGHLQRNKVRKVLPITDYVHSVDSLRLLSAINRLGEELDMRPRVLLEVNVAGEEVKDGFSEEELVIAWNDVAGFDHIDVVGLMTMAPFANDVEEARLVFQRLRSLRDRLRRVSPNGLALNELSMGMSRDFEVAIEEGATIIRVGRTLYKGLERQA